jgi:hypothetical protein
MRAHGCRSVARRDERIGLFTDKAAAEEFLEPDVSLRQFADERTGTANTGQNDYNDDGLPSSFTLVIGSP